MKVPFLSLRGASEELRAELDQAWRTVLDSGSYMLGEQLRAFEREFAAFCGARHCVGHIAGSAQRLGEAAGEQGIVFDDEDVHGSYGINASVL